MTIREIQSLQKEKTKLKPNQTKTQTNQTKKTTTTNKKLYVFLQLKEAKRKHVCELKDF